MIKKIILAAPLMLAIAAPLNAAGFKNVPFYAWTKLLPNGSWQVQIDGQYPRNWACKGAMQGSGKDWTALPAQNIALHCINGPSSGRATFVPIGGVGFAKFQYQLDNGYQGKATLK